MALLRLDGVRKHFGDHHVLTGVSLEVDEGQVVCLIGASGSGKSTLLRCVDLLEVVDDGTIWLDDRDITAPDVNPDGVRREVAIVFQAYNLFPHLSVLDNITLGPTTLAAAAAPGERANGRSSCSSDSAWPRRRARIPTRSPVVSSNGWR